MMGFRHELPSRLAQNSYTLPEEALRAAALQEAVRHGSAQPKSVLGKVLGAHADLRLQARELGIIAARIVTEVNALSPEEVAAQAPVAPSSAGHTPHRAIPRCPA